MHSAGQFIHARLLSDGLEDIRESPKELGRVVMIVRRPRVGEREPVESGELDLAEGLVGDNWRTRPNSSTPNGQPNQQAQVTLMNARVIDLVAGQRAHWPLAGDQFFVDLDLSAANLPPGARVALGAAVVEISAHPHLGCKKFLARFGPDALEFVNSETGRALRLRGVNARIVMPGSVRVGDAARKL